MKILISILCIISVSGSSCNIQSDVMTTTTDDECGGSYGSASWPACCTTDAECRTFEFVPPVGSTGPCGGTEGGGDTMSLNITFGPDTDEDCCVTCSCYGDPECFSFDHTFSKWIVCDGRTTDSCLIQKNKCLSLTDNNDNSCVWRNGRKKNSRGYNVGLNGSPCIPDFKNGPAPTMQMIDIPGVMEVVLELGERSIITNVLITVDGVADEFDAERCFDGNPFKGSVPPYATPESSDRGRIERTWIIQHEGIFMQMVCIRLLDNKKNPGRARINVQELAVPNEMSASGFCSTNIIDKVGGLNPDTEHIHETCVQNETSALQACKALLEPGVVPSEMQECATKYCNGGYGGSRTKCLQELVPPNDYSLVTDRKKMKKAVSMWTYYYCSNVVKMNKVKSLSECRHYVYRLGWWAAVEKWGNGIGHMSCTPAMDDLEQYRIGRRMNPCEHGVFIDVDMGNGWEEKYFIPENLCGGVSSLEFTVTPEMSPMLFNPQNRIQVRQCTNGAGVDKHKCSIDRCKSTRGVSFSIDYSSIVAKIMKLYADGNLCSCDQETGECEKI